MPTKEHVKLLPEAQHGLTVIPETKSKATHPIPDSYVYGSDV